MAQSLVTGIDNGAYKMDLGAAKPIASITSWSHHFKGTRGPQNVTLYASASPTDPGWDLSKFVALGTLDTTKEKSGAFSAVSLRATEGKSMGTYRWIVWAAAPITARGGGENTAFQELAVGSFRNRI